MIPLRRASRSRIALDSLGWALFGLAVWPCLAAAGNRADLSLGRPGTGTDLMLDSGGEARSAALARYSAALQLETQGKMREALGHYRELLKADPANAGLAARTAELAVNYSGRTEAVRILRDAIRAAPGSPRPLLNLARFLSTYESDEPAEADAAFAVLQEALQKFPQSAEVYQTAVMMTLSAPPPGGDQVPNPADPGKAGLAKRMLDHDQTRLTAGRILEQALKQPVADPDFWLALGRTAQEAWPLGQAEDQFKNRERVNAFYEAALRNASRSPAPATVQLDVASFYVQTNQLKQAAAICEKTAAEHNSTQARKLLFRLRQADGKSDEAFQLLERIVADNPHDSEQRKLLAELCEQKRDYAAAARHREAAIQMSGGEAADYLALAQAILNSGQHDKAIQFARRSLKLFPEQLGFRIMAALAFKQAEDWDRAIAEWSQAEKHAQESAPDRLNSWFYFQYGATLERARRYREAADQFEKSISLTPKSDEGIREAANTMNYLGYMWLEQDANLIAAGDLIRKANELVPDNAAFVDSLGWLHFKQGDYQKALTELLRAESLLKDPEPGDAEIIDHIGQAYERLGDRQKAIEHLKKAAALNPEDEKIQRRLDDLLGKPKPLPKPPAEDPERGPKKNA